MVRVLEACTFLRVQSWKMPTSVPARVELTLGVRWPMKTGSTASGPVDVLCVGPTDWLVIGPDIEGTPQSIRLLHTLNEAFTGSSFRAADLSSSLTRIRVEGVHARALLSKASSLDFHPKSFLPGQSARTRFASLPVVVHCIRNSDFDCIVPMSYREYLSAWLNDAAQEFVRPLESGS